MYIHQKQLGSCCAPCTQGKRCAGSPTPAGGISGGVTTSLVLIGAGVLGAAVLFPRAWDRMMRSMWGR